MMMLTNWVFLKELAPPLIQFDEMSFSYDKSKMGRGPQEIFSKVTFSLDMDSRVALVSAHHSLVNA